MHDKLGREGDFSNSIIIFTSNIGSQWIAEQIQKGHQPTSNELIEVMSKYFRPEFLGRLTEVVPFSPITEAVAQQIFLLQFSRLQKQLLEQKDIQLDLAPETIAYLTSKGFSATVWCASYCRCSENLSEEDYFQADCLRGYQIWRPHK